MSLVSTYVRATDGRLYKNPVLIYDEGFICFDDDDLPELILWRDRKNGTNPSVFLSSVFGLGGFSTPRPRGFMGRIDHQAKEEHTFRDSYCFWFELLAPIPVPQEHGGFVDSIEEIGQAVIYDPKGN